MRFATYETDGRTSYGLVLDGGAILDLPGAARIAGQSAPEAGLLAFIAAGPTALEVARRLAAEAGDARFRPATHAGFRLLAPIPRPAKNVFCVGRNYRDHVAEGYRAAGAATKLPEHPQFFTKPPTAVIGPGAAFHHDPAVTRRLDYEVELAVVIGAAGRDIAPGAAMGHVFGYTILNDITARDLQRRHDQWFKGKGLDRSAPMGPWIVHRDAIADVEALELTLAVDGEERQRGRVSDMIFPIPAIIATLSAGLTLEAGDIIATGTPSGVGYAMDPPRYLEAGNVVACAISGIGELVTPIAGPAA